MNQNNIPTAILAANYLAAMNAKSNNGGLNPSIVKEIQNGNIELQPGGLMHAATFADGNQVDVLEPSNVRSNGKSDFDGRKLPANTAAIVTGLKIGFVEAAENSDVAGVQYDSDRENLPASFVNSILEIKQEGKLKLRIPVARLLTQVNADSQSGDIYSLPGFMLLNGDTDTEIRLLMPSGVSMNIGVGNAAYARVDFEGFVTRTRA